jgi:WD40 repeat protein
MSGLHERDLVWVDEVAPALTVGMPSPEVLAGIEANFRYLRRNLRQRIEGIAIAVLVVVVAGGSVSYARRNVALARVQEQAATGRAANARAQATAAAAAEAKATAAAAAAAKRRDEAERLTIAARRATQEELGTRAVVLAGEPGREHEALLAGVLALGPSLKAGEPAPLVAVHGVSEAVAAAARSMPMAGGWTFDARVGNDGKRIVSLAADGVRWWDSETGTLLRHIRTSAGAVDSVAFCAGSGLVALDVSVRSDAERRDVQLWDINTMRRWRTLVLDRGRVILTCSSDRRWAVLGGRGGEERLWDLERAIDVGPLLVGAEPKFTTDGTRLVSGAAIVEIPSRRVIARLINPVPSPAGERNRSMAEFRFSALFDRDRRLAAASELGNVTIWGVYDGMLQSSFVVTEPRYTVVLFADLPTLHPAISSMSVSQDGRQIAVADVDSRISIWTTEPGASKPVATLDVLASEDAPPRGLVDTSLQATRGVVTQVQFVGSGTLAFSTDRGRVSFRAAFNLARQVSVQEPQCPAESEGKRAQMPHFTVSPNQLEMVTFGCFAGLRRWSFADSVEWAFRDHARLVVYGGNGREIEGAGFGRDGRTIVIRTEDRDLAALDRQTGSPLRRVPAAASAATPLLGASRIVGTTVESETLGSAEASRGTHSPSGRLLVSCCRNPAAVWDAAEGRRLITMRRGSAVVQFAPDEQDLIAFVEPHRFGARRSYTVYSLDPTWYFRRACLMLSDAARPQAAEWCGGR